jgi:small subunit ribosomal protein S16
MRLTRTGARKRPSYRIIVTDARAPRDGRHVDILGFYDPMTTPSTVKIDVERAVRWLRHGAQPTDRVRILLRHAGVLKAHEEARLADKRVRREGAGPLGPPATAGGAAGEAAPPAPQAAPTDTAGVGA